MRTTTPQQQEAAKNVIATDGNATTNPLQLKQPTNNPLQLQKENTAASPPQQNNTGLPDNLKTGVEALSGYSMDDVNVHYNSDKPAQLQALAYAQGTDIHIAPGQEKHLPHEAWHVVQQKQGRVQATMQMKQGIAVNDNTGLEHEADVMGTKALSTNETMAGNAGHVELRNIQIVQRMYNGSDDEDEGTGEKKEGNEKGADKKDQKKEKETDKQEQKKQTTTGNKPTTRGKRNKQTGGQQKNPGGNTTGNKSKIPGTESELIAAARGLPIFQRMGLEPALTFFRARIKPGIYDGTQEEWEICRGLAEKILNKKESTTTVESEDTKKQQAIKGFHKKYEIIHTREITEVQPLGIFSNDQKPNNSHGNTAFVANLITTPVDLQELVDRYAKLYNPQSTGFSMVIGLNRFRSCDKLHENLLTNIKLPNAPFPLTILVFSWDLPWNAPFENVCEDYNLNVNISGFNESIKQYETSFLRGKKNVVPYGTLRSQVLAHSATSEYVQAFSKNFKNVYIFNTDADAPSFQTQEQKNNPQAPPLLEAYAREIKSRNRPNLMVGGYRFDKETTGGDLKSNNPAHRLTLLDNRLDSEFRIMVSKINSELIYPTEPNMIFPAAHNGDMSPLKSLTNIPANTHKKKDNKVTPPWGSGPREGIRLRQNIRMAGNTGNNITTYLPQLSTPTDSTRFRVPFFKPDTELISSEKFFENRMEAMFSEEQTYITKLAVMIEGSGAAGTYPLNPAWVQKFIKHTLFEAIKDPYSVDTKKVLPPPTQQDTKAGIAGLFEEHDLITWFIVQNITIIKKIHKELSRQYFILKSIYSSGVGSVNKDVGSSSGVNQPLESNTKEEVAPLSSDSIYWKKKIFEIIRSLLNNYVTKDPLGANNCLIEAILNKLNIPQGKRATIIKNVREALDQNQIHVGEMLHATEGILQLIAVEIEKETGITIGNVTIDYNHISNEIQQNIEHMDNTQLNNLLDNITEDIHISNGQNIAITHTGFAHFK